MSMLLSSLFGQSWLLLVSLGVVRMIKDHYSADPSSTINKLHEENLRQNVGSVPAAQDDPHKLISIIKYTGSELYVNCCCCTQYGLLLLPT